jgi:hypothetical protein
MELGPFGSEKRCCQQSANAADAEKKLQAGSLLQEFSIPMLPMADLVASVRIQDENHEQNTQTWHGRLHVA